MPCPPPSELPPTPIRVKCPSMRLTLCPYRPARQVRFSFPTPSELPPPLIQLIDVSFKYPGREDFGLKDLNIGVDMGSRVAIVGPNGAGKG